MSTLIGKYEFDSAENIDEYLKGLGVGLVLRKVQSVAKPNVEIKFSPDTNEWTISTETPFKSHELKFQAGIRVQDETYDARSCTTKATIEEDGKIILEQQCDDGPEVTVTNERLENGMLRMTFTSGDQTATHLYRKITEE